MKPVKGFTLICLVIIVVWIVVALRTNDQGEVTDRRRGVSSVNSHIEPTYSLKINGQWHQVSAETYRRCSIGEQHPTCKTR